MNGDRDSAAAQQIKRCCAQLYESDLARMLLGESFHPGGLRLTERLGALLGLTPKMHVLDVASGTGTSAIFLAEHFGCRVTGVDFSAGNVEKANQTAAAKGLAGRVHFERGDAEGLAFGNGSFDAVFCECAYCTFPSKSAAAREFARVLVPGGRLALSDVTRGSMLPEGLESLLATVACVAEAKSVEEYVGHLSSAQLAVQIIEPHGEALAEMVAHIRKQLFGAEILMGLEKLALPGVDLASAKQLVKIALTAIEQGQLGYAIFIAAKSAAAH